MGTAPEEGQALAAAFLGHLESERRLSPLTRDGYARDIRVLLELAADTRLADLTPHNIRRFVAVLHGRGLSGRSLARALSAWRGFFRYLARDHGLEASPAEGVRAPKVKRTLPHALSPDEAARLLEFPGGGLLAARDRAMFELFYSSGLRLSELAGLDVAAIDRADGTVRVTGKGAKTRVVPVGRAALEALEQWLALRRDIRHLEGDALFVTGSGRRVSPRAIQQRLRALAIRQGIPANVHPHVLRHSFASHLLQSSGDLRAVQELLGHASISTTQVYTHLDFQHLAKVYDSAHPRAKRKK
ncbi:MAG: tyrosine recombinase XerC [Pseudomonadota bacterium]